MNQLIIFIYPFKYNHKAHVSAHEKKKQLNMEVFSNSLQNNKAIIAENLNNAFKVGAAESLSRFFTVSLISLV